MQEVDHFEFLRRSLSALGYEGRFFPKPDSPCLYLDENTGPDGCAVFYKADRFEMTRSESRVIEVWGVESNQVRVHDYTFYRIEKKYRVSQQVSDLCWVDFGF